MVTHQIFIYITDSLQETLNIPGKAFATSQYIIVIFCTLACTYFIDKRETWLLGR